MCNDQNKYKLDPYFTISLTSCTITVTNFVEGAMNELIMIMIDKLIKVQYNTDVRLTKVDFSGINITQVTSEILFNSLFINNTSLNFIEELDLKSQNFSFDCIPIIVTSLQYCAFKNLVFPDIRILDMISKKILQDSYAQKNICNFFERIPLTTIVKAEVNSAMIQ